MALTVCTSASLYPHTSPVICLRTYLGFSLGVHLFSRSGKFSVISIEESLDAFSFNLGSLCPVTASVWSSDHETELLASAHAHLSSVLLYLSTVSSVSVAPMKHHDGPGEERACCADPSGPGRN